MTKILTIAWKDLIVTFNDRTALILMLAAPFVLTLAFGFVTGAFSGSGTGGTGLADIPVILVNQDEGDLGQALVDLFADASLDELLAAETAETTPDAITAARRRVDADEVAALVIIPAGFSATVLPEPGVPPTDDKPVVPIEVYTSPARPISAGVVRSIVTTFISRVEQGVITAEIAVGQLISSGLIVPEEIPAVAERIGRRAAESGQTTQLISLRTETGAPVPEEPQFNLLAFLAPGMAILFLMYTVSLGGRTFLSEREEGTLPRLMTTPTSTPQIIAGKMLGIFFTGAAQLAILLLSYRFLLQIDYGAVGPVVLLVVAVAVAATGWGILLAALSRTQGQVATTGMVMMLVFGIMGGTFTGPQGIPVWLRPLSRLTPNYWGLLAFTELNLGGSLADITMPLLWLGGTAVLLFLIATFAFRRQYR